MEENEDEHSNEENDFLDSEEENKQKELASFLKPQEPKAGEP